MLRRIVIVCVLLSVVSDMVAQEKHAWTLDECITFAEQHSISVRKQSLAVDRNGVSVQEGQWAFVPSFSVSTGYTMSTGRVLDPTTYQFVETSYTGNSSSSLSSDITLFEGGRKVRNLKRAKLSLKSEILKEESVKLDLRLNIIAAFMDVLCAKEQTEVAAKTVSLVKSQLERSKAMLEAGSITESDVLQIQSQLFSADNDLSSSKYSYEMAKLALCDLIEIEDYSEFEAVGPTGEAFVPILDNVDSVVDNNPEYQVSVMQNEIAEAEYKIARSSLSPRISLSAGYGSSYSDARQKMIQNPDGTFKYEAYPFFEQYVDNASTYASVNLSIPILTGLSANHSIKKAQIGMKEAELATIEMKKSLRKRILQADIDYRSAKEKYERSIQEVEYAEEAQRQIEEKYNLGTTDYLSWMTAVVELAKARYSLAESKYTLFLKAEILKYYYN